MIARIFIFFLMLLPTVAWASGFYLPWWFNATLWLLGTPEGIVVLFLICVLVVGGLFALVRRLR